MNSFIIFLNLDLKQLQSFKSEVAIVKTDDEHFVVAVRKHSDAFQSMNQFESRLGPFRLRDFGDNVLQAIATYLILAKEIKNQNVALVMKEINNVFGDLST